MKLSNGKNQHSRPWGSIAGEAAKISTASRKLDEPYIDSQSSDTKKATEAGHTGQHGQTDKHGSIEVVGGRRPPRLCGSAG